MRGVSAASTTDDLRRRCRKIASLLHESEGEAALAELLAELSLVTTRLGVVVVELQAPVHFAIEVELARSELASLKSALGRARREEDQDVLRAHLGAALDHAFETMSWVERTGVVRGWTATS